MGIFLADGFRFLGGEFLRWMLLGGSEGNSAPSIPFLRAPFLAPHTSIRRRHTQINDDIIVTLLVTITSIRIYQSVLKMVSARQYIISTKVGREGGRDKSQHRGYDFLYNINRYARAGVRNNIRNKKVIVTH